MSSSEKGHVPVYLKLIIALCILGFIGLLVVVVMSISLVKNNFGPGNAVKVAHELVQLPDPLPPGWQYGVGLDVGVQKVANLQYINNGKPMAMVQFMTIAQKSRVPAKELISKIALPSVAGMKSETLEQGEETVGGKTAYYTRIHTTVMNRESAEEIALIDLPGGKMLEIQSTEHNRDTFDPKLIEPLLNSITGFGSGSQ